MTSIGDRRSLYEEVVVPGVLEYRSVTLEAASRIVAVALSRAEKCRVPVAVAVVDRGGATIVVARMDGAPPVSADLAQDKAWTVMHSGMATQVLGEFLRHDAVLLHGLSKVSRLSVLPGGCPVLCGDERAGAVGVSGGTAEQDQLIAEAAAGALARE
jgi:uncharacterized protein GlcG (DUF336 family)